jgi:hypothetical protein
VGSAGEVHFVFQAAPIVQSQFGPDCAPMSFTVIFEYQVTASTCADVAAWAQRWIDLDQWTPGSADFNQALEKITEDVISGKSGPLAQVRTNEIDLDDSIGKTAVWEMREFGPGLVERGVRRTPLDKMNLTLDLSKWVIAHQSDVDSELHEVDASVAGANPQNPQKTKTPVMVFWDGARGQSFDIPAETRVKFSMNACTGCHARETCTRFQHVIGGVPDQEATLSGFLNGTVIVPDPVFCAASSCTTAPSASCPTPSPVTAAPTGKAALLTSVDACCRQPNELERRRQVLDLLTNCFMPNPFEPLNAAH